MTESVLYDILTRFLEGIYTEQENLQGKDLFPLVLLYAEIHYRFKYFMSFLKRRRPEIIVDVPPRLFFGKPFFLLVIIKDADKYPIIVDRGTVRARFSPTNKWEEIPFDLGKMEISDRFREIIIDLPLADSTVEEIELQVSIHGRYLKSGKPFIVVNDNYPGGFRDRFKVRVARESLPAEDGWACGDIHCHSRFTDDQLEFGAGLEGISRMAAAAGYSWVGVTDHSYDLDDLPSDYLRNDPHIKKWKTFLDGIERLNSFAYGKDHPVLIPGEEVSCGSARETNIHLLVLGNNEFIPGNGDSGEKLFRSAPTLPLNQVLDRLCSQYPRPAAFVAHPFQKISVFERIFLNRREWEASDLREQRLDGWQIWNRNKTESRANRKGLEHWIRQLLAGQKISLAAGSDSHGNFGVGRSVGIPFLWLRVAKNVGWTKIWTLVRTDDASVVSPQDIIRALRGGRTVISSGPFVNLTLLRNGRPVGKIGDTVKWTDNLELEILALSSSEFGGISQCQVYFGVTGWIREFVIWELDSGKQAPSMKLALKIALPAPSDDSLKVKNSTWKGLNSKPGQACSGYIRAQVESYLGENTFEALTSPVWLSASINE